MSCPADTWDAVVEQLGELPYRTDLRVCACSVPHPSEAGMRRGMGLPRPGALEQWRLALPDGSGLHVVEYSDHYKAHLDEVDPATSAAEHVRRDAPGVAVYGAGVLGGLLGLVFGTLVGGPLGAYVGAVNGAAAGGRMAAVWVDKGSDPVGG